MIELTTPPIPPRIEWDIKEEGEFDSFDIKN